MPGRTRPTDAPTADAPPRRHGPLGWYVALRDALDRPLTSYYLLLGASALLLTIGLIMVLSASSVYSYEQNAGDSYAIVRRQLMWVVLGLPLAFVASRLPHRLRWRHRQRPTTDRPPHPFRCGQGAKTGAAPGFGWRPLPPGSSSARPPGGPLRGSWDKGARRRPPPPSQVRLHESWPKRR